MSPEWIQVRMRRSTYARLRVFGKRTLDLVHCGRLMVENPRDGELSADALVSLLLDRDDNHQERNARRKRGKKCVSTM